MRGRLVAARIIAGIGALFWGWLFFGVQDSLTVFVEGKDFAPHYLMETGWGLLFLVLVAVPLLGLAWRPQSAVLVAQVAAVGVAIAAAAAVARSAAHLLPALGLWLTAIAVATASKLRLRGDRPRVDRPLAAMAVAAAVPALTYAWRMATAHVAVEQTVGLDHYPIQAALGIGIVLVAIVVAVSRHWPGSRLAAATLAVTVAWMGVESAVFPHRLGSFGPIWSWLALGWAVAFLALSFRPVEADNDNGPGSR